MSRHIARIGAIAVTLQLLAAPPVMAQIGSGARFGGASDPIGQSKALSTGIGTRFGVAPDPIDQSKALSTQPTHRLPAPPPAVERLVPERRVFVPELNREVV